MQPGRSGGRCALGMDLGLPTLDRYQRWRRFDTMAMGLATNC
jgi:hypothetical protein